MPFKLSPEKLAAKRENNNRARTLARQKAREQGLTLPPALRDFSPEQMARRRELQEIRTARRKTRKGSRATTLNAARATASELVRLQVMNALEPYPPGEHRPLTRSECAEVCRPCPWVSCRHHLFLDVNATGGVKLNHPDLNPDELTESCSLDVADRGGDALEAIGLMLNLTRERIRQLEDRALAKLRADALLRESAEP